MVFNSIKKILQNNKIKSYLRKSKIGATTDLAIFNVKRNSESLILYDKLRRDCLKSSNHLRGGVGQRYITIIVNERYYDEIYNMFEKYLVSCKKKIGLITIDCEHSDKITGLIAYISALIFKKNINLHGFFTSQNDILLILDEEKTFEYVDYLKNNF